VERRKNVYEPAIASRQEYNNMLALGHYRNKLVHCFYREGESTTSDPFSHFVLALFGRVIVDWIGFEASVN
jgi:hypothetical protein